MGEAKHTPELWALDGMCVMAGREAVCWLGEPAQYVGDTPSMCANWKANAARIVACVNALRGLDVAKVEALLDAVRAESESKYDDKISVAEHTRRQHVRMNACDELRDSIRAGGGQ